VSEPETHEQPAEGVAQERAPVERPVYVTQRNPHIPECAFCRRQVAPLLYVLVPKKAGDKAPQKVLGCPDCLPGLLTHTLALLEDPQLAAFKHLNLPELVKVSERKAMGEHLAAAAEGGKKHKRR
jgi:hypothetical protein